jgi:hypothetical protein
MPSDRSRPPDDSRDQYTGGVMQQGRVILDRDFNTVREILDRRIAREALDVIGPFGTPDDGFAISLPFGSPPLWVPPLPLSPPELEAFDFLIAPGTMYVGGERVVFPAREAGRLITYSYFDQPDVIARESQLFRFPPHQEVVYLHLAEQEVSVTEDPDLLDVALGGPDTTQRLRLMRTVRRHDVKSADCTAAWGEATADWQSGQGLVFDPDTMRLLPEVRLQVGFTQTTTEANPCDPVATGGYLGADNQLIRVQIADPGGMGSPPSRAQLLWSYDNASFVYRVTSVDSSGKRLQLTRDPPDAFHMPQTGQAVEVLRTAAILGSEPDETDPTGRRTIVRCITESTGFVTTLAQSYDPTSTAKALVLNDALPPDYAGDLYPLFVRVWQGLESIAPSGGTVELTDPVSGTTTGVEVTLSLPTGAPLTKGVFWMMALRPSTPQAVYPERLLTSSQPPTGPRLWACPLAVIDWMASPPAVQNCGQSFDNLVDLSKRKLGGCCTVSVSEGTTLQSVIDGAVGLAAQVTVCLGPGSYTLDQPLRLDARHKHMVIEACGGAAIITGAGPAFADGLIVLTDAPEVTLHGLTLIPAPVDVSPALFQPLFAGLERSVVLQGRAIVPEFVKVVLEPRFEMRLMIGVRAVGSTNLTLKGCTVLLNGGPVQENHFGIGLLVTGDCSGLTVQDCRFASRFTPTSTSGIVQPAGFSVPRFQPPGQPPRFGLQGAVGCLASPYVSGFPNPDQNGLEQFTLPALLQDATLSDNSFADMTLAISVMAEIGTLRIHANTVADSVAGFWIKTSELREFQFTGDPAGRFPFDGDLTWLDLALVNQECFLLLVLGLVYPPPKGAAMTVAQQITGPASIFIAENHVAALPPDAARAPEGGSLALAVLTGPPGGYTATFAPPPDQFSGLAVSANRFQGRPGFQYPAVMLVYSGRCAVTGNLISAESATAAQTPTSLYIVPEGNRVQTSDTPAPEVLAPHLSVTGNVLEGAASNLNLLFRPDTPALPAPFNTWLPFNATA